MSKAPISDIRVTAADTGERKSGLIRFLPAWLIANASNPTRRYWMLSILILAIAAGLRLVGLFDDFWLDEIWSWSFARAAKSAGEIFYKIHHDNNHYLNTLWLYVCGNRPEWYIYRLHSYAAGLLTIVGSGMLAGDVAFDCFLGQPISGKSRKSKSAAESLPSRYNNASQFARAAALATMFLLTTCHMACVYSTEARGYALAGAAAVFSTWILRQIVVDAKTGTVRFHLILVYFGLSAIGFLSHLSYATIYLPQIVWSVTLLFLRRCYSPIIGCHLPVFLLLAGLWLFDLQYAKVGGAPRQSAFWVGIEALALPTGAAYPDGLVLLCAAATLVGFSIGLVYVFQRSPTDAWLWGLMLFCSPPLMLAMRSDGLIHARHFLVVWMTLFPMLGIGLVQIVSRSRNLVSVPVVLVLVCWLATNGWEFSRFATYGRGGFHRSAEWIVAEALKTNAGVNQPQTIGSDHDFRNSLVLSYYMPRIPNNECLTYVKQGMWPAEGVDWVFVHKIDRNFIPPPEQQIGAWRYELAHYEPFAAPIGWHWAIYRRMK